MFSAKFTLKKFVRTISEKVKFAEGMWKINSEGNWKLINASEEDYLVKFGMY